ncbi:MAG: hypothetical protein HZB16_03555 [Armatimonadetes bacterium]|nr:hypothetical protein [Armatimonadota bacterium]
MRERLSALRPYAKYWPVALFVLANMAAVGLVIRAQTASDEGVATSTIRRPTDVAADKLGVKPPEALDLESARAAADVPMVLDWSKAPGDPRPSTEQTAAPGRSLIERLAMGLGNLRDDARAAYDRDTRLNREAMLGIRSTLLTGNLPAIGNPLLPAWNSTFMPPYDPLGAGLRSAEPPVTEIEVPAGTTQDELVALAQKYQIMGLRVRISVRGSGGVPAGVAAGMGNVRTTTVPSGLGGMMAALPGPPPDVAAPGAEPRAFSDSRPRVVEVNPAGLTGAPAGVDAPRYSTGVDDGAPSGVRPPSPASTEAATSQLFLSSTIASRAEADAVAARLRSSGGQVTVQPMQSGVGFKVNVRIACRKSQRGEMAAQLSDKAGVTMRLRT